MSQPPSQLRIKRRREDDPVEALYIRHEDTSKRTAINKFVYKRIAPTAAPHTPSQSPPKNKNQNQNDTAQRHTAAPSPRRFTLSVTPGSSAGRKRRATETGNIATFIEEKRRQLNPTSTSKSRFQRTTGDTAPQTPSKLSHAVRAPSPELVLAPTADPTAPHYFAQTPPASKGRKADIKNGKPRPPPARLNGLATSPDAKTKAFLSSFAEEAISPDRDTHMTGTSTTSTSTQNGSKDGREDGEGEDEDMGEYVYETYIRTEVPQSSAAADGPDQNEGKEIGYLVIHASQDELWESYAELNSDEEGDWDSEQDDENAENYYGADYPEDEVSDDDEFGRDEWKYRTRPGDEEEFDLVNDEWSDVGSDADGEIAGVGKGKNEFEFVAGRGKGVVD